MTTPERQRSRQQTIIGLLLLIAAGLGFIIIYQLGFVNPRTAAVEAALCAQRVNLQEQITTTQAFLRHPEDFPAFDDPKTLALIRAQLPGQQRTVAIYGALDCG